MILAAWTALVILFLLLPLAVIVLFSFNARDLTVLPMTGPSLRWYAKLFSSSELLDALANSLVIAMATMVIATALGTLASIGLRSLAPRTAGIARPLLSAPFMAPRLVVGIALLNAFSLAGVDLSLLTVVAGHVTIAVPYVLLVVSARLAGLDPAIEEAARDLGAGRLAVLRDITLPALRPAIISAALIAATLSFDEVVITFFTAGAQNTLPTTIWGMLRFGITPEINAVSTLAMGLTILLALAAERLLRR
jgi:spermidine/putrescine transport system permease protein